MVSIIKKKWKEKGMVSYYVYDYIYDSVNKKFNRAYIGTTDEKAYRKYRKQVKDEDVYCKTCGRRKKEALPDYLKESNLKVCMCES